MYLTHVSPTPWNDRGENFCRQKFVNPEQHWEWDRWSDHQQITGVPGSRRRVNQVEEARRADWRKAVSGLCSSHRSWGGFKLTSVGTESWRDDKTWDWFKEDLLRANWISYPHTWPRHRLQQHWFHANFGNLLSENYFKLSGWGGIGVLMKELVAHGILPLV